LDLGACGLDSVDDFDVLLEEFVLVSESVEYFKLVFGGVF
jgi:hypothetical protein